MMFFHLLRLQQENQLLSQVTADDELAAAGGEQKTTESPVSYLYTHTHTPSPAVHLTSAHDTPICLCWRKENSEDEACAFSLFEGSGSLSWRTLMKMTSSHFSSLQINNPKRLYSSLESAVCEVILLFFKSVYQLSFLVSTVSDVNNSLKMRDVKLETRRLLG